MSIEIPGDVLTALAKQVASSVAPALDDVKAKATAGTGDCPGVLHQPASSKLEAIFGKLGADAELGAAATRGLSKGLTDVVAKFGELDTKATPHLGGHR
jgi:hypothetical protein